MMLISHHEIPIVEMQKASRYGNFSQPMQRVSKASVPSVRCSSKSSSLSANFSPPLSLRKPLRLRLTPADWRARIRSLEVLAVDEGHEALFAGKGLVDEQILFVVAHRVADIHCLHCPTVTLKLHIE